MIGKIQGILDTIQIDGSIIVMVQGVGYVVFVSARTRSRLPGQGEATSLLIETHVREDHIHLYGFLDAKEQGLFRLLTSVQGVGNKAALAILSIGEPEAILMAIAAEDKAMLSRAEGVGPKLAGRIASELKDKVGTLQTFTPQAATSATTSRQAEEGHPASQEGPSIAQTQDPVWHDALSALTNLGYGRSESFAALSRIREQANDDLQTCIRLALKELSS